MISKPIDVLSKHPVRKKGKQKRNFRSDVCDFLKENGYSHSIESNRVSKNVVIGNPDGARYVITAHYDTPAGMPFPNLITPIHFVPFLLWQLLTLVILFVPNILISFLLAYYFDSSSIGRYAFCLLSLIDVVFLMLGPANKNNANDNTSGVVTLLDMACKLPESLREDVCFVLFDLEEAGMLGSSYYAFKHSEAVKNQIVINLDCVGEGENILFFPNSRFRKDSEKMKWLHNVSNSSCEKNLRVVDGGFSYYPSDQLSFPLGVGVAALKKSKNGWLYLDKIHTSKDTTLDYSNVEALSSILISLIEDNTAVQSASNDDVKSKKLSNSVLIGILIAVSCIVGLVCGLIAGIQGW